MQKGLPGALRNLKWIKLTLIVISLAACTPAAPPTPTLTPTLSPTSTTTPFSFPATETPDPNEDDPAGPGAATAVPAASPGSIAAGPSPTFDARSAVTRTPLPPALCPARNLTILADEEAWDQHIADGDADALLEALQYHLNIGGALEPAAAALRRLRGTGSLTFYREADVTGDGRDEIVFAGRQAYVLFCAVGFYELRAIPERLADDQPAALDPEVLFLGDMNRTGVPEIVLFWDVPCDGAAVCGALVVLEWEGNDFASLLENDPENTGIDIARMHAAFDVRFADLDGNGTVEILLDGEIPDPASAVYRDGLPWRERTDTYMWNGEHFVLHKIRYATPEYRFQAVQDGDLFTLQGDYKAALLSYQLAVFGDAPEWWSPERAEELRALWGISIGGDAPTPEPAAPDPAEYGHLAAYARFRIMVLYLLQGWESDAETVFNTLTAAYPDGEDGFVFAETAAAFWEAYRDTEDIGAACARAIAFVEAHPEVLFFLGAEHHGRQSKIYAPEDVCPFTVRSYAFANSATPAPSSSTLPAGNFLKTNAAPNIDAPAAATNGAAGP
ncbi:MAG TPA: hypothetical protein VMN57_12320, partial [Anaerolineales bacterium]|nr:hypothetical protein [Anaerolineales bacterium]